MITNDLVRTLLQGSLPPIPDRVNNIILWFGHSGKALGELQEIEPATHQFVVGTESPDGFGLIVENLFARGLLTGNLLNTAGRPGHALAALSIEGWEYFDRLQRGATHSRKAFMAMPYGNAELDKLVKDVLRPAVTQAGYQLVRLDDVPQAGLIDDRLRVEIRNCRFLIADLTHGNHGAYWEAGYAEGLGKTVIYTCEKGKFESEPSHFDTNHHLTILWDRADLGKAAEQLKATIRVTLPDEAKLED